jgi:hypothetical protein
MRQAGKLEAISQQLQVPRQGGYSDVDMVVVLLCFLCSAIDSIKDFGRRSRPWRTELAAVANRKGLPAPSSMSRYLNGAQLEHIEPFVDAWLLSLADGEIIGDERAAWRDSQGKRWWLFDWDPTIITVRKRGLPSLESLPEAKRRAKKAKPGYSGRKRGEAQFCRSIIQQAASAQPVGMRLQSGNGELHELISHAVDTVARAAARADIPRRQTVVRVDGLGGCVPFIAECEESSLRYVARLSRYHFLESLEVAQHLDQVDWELVQDSGSGPRREAADLGWVKIHPGAQTRRVDGSRFDPTRARVVVSRFRPTESATGSGRTIDGWVYEMYATNLPPRSWPKADIVGLYFARAGCENHYAEMIREQKINRLFCYEPAGQLLVTTLALWLFGRHAQWGRLLGSEPAGEIPQRTRDSADAASRTSFTRGDRHSILGSSRTATSEVDHINTRQLLSDDEAAEILKRFDDSWRWDSSLQAFICGREQPLTIRKVRGDSVVFGATRSACRGCPFRQKDGDQFRCSRSTNPEFRKEIWVKLGIDRVKQLEMDKLRKMRPKPRRNVDFEPIKAPAGPWELAPPSLFPAYYRKQFQQACEDVEVEVTLEPSSQPPPPIRTIAEVRQRRRLSWQQRHLKGKLRAGTVCLTLRGGPALGQYFRSLDSVGDDGYLIEIAS